jgi:hypothetical protein
MRYFFATLLILNINILAAAEVWHYRIENDRFNDDRIIATRTVKRNSEDFVVLEPENGYCSFKDFFQAPKTALSKFLIGKFTLQSRSDSSAVISSHFMCVTFDWINENGILVPSSLRSVPYQNEHKILF